MHIPFILVDKTIVGADIMYNNYYRNPEIPNNDFHNDTVALQINCAGREVNKNGTGADSIRSDYYLFYLYEGKVQINSPINQIMNPGDICIFDRNTHFSYHSCDNIATTHYFVHFTGRYALDLISSCHLNVSAVYNITQSLQPYFEDIFKSFLLRDSYFDLDNTAKLVSLFIAIGRYNSSKYELPGVNNQKRFTKSIAYIHDHFTTDFSISDLAKIENLSESRYRAIFSNVFNQSPSQYITDLRINLACNFLCTCDMSIDQIALLAGYHDARYFSRIFKKKLLISPTEYRQTHQLNMQQQDMERK